MYIINLFRKIESVNVKEVREAFTVFLFVFPMVTRWLFSASMEARLTIMLFDFFPFYPVDICYLLFPFFATFRKRTATVSICLCFLLLQLVSVCVGFFMHDYTDFRLVIWGNMHYFVAMIFAFYFPFSEKQIRVAGIILLFAFILLTVQILLYSTGILSHSVEISHHEYAGISRISTTIGAATGTGVIMFMLGGLVFYLYERTKWKYLVLLLWGTSVFLTISRGPSLSFMLFILYFLCKEISISKTKLRTFSRLMVSFLLLGAILYFSGFITPLLERSVSMTEEENITSGREGVFITGFRIFMSNPVWGVGHGNVFCAKDLTLYSELMPTHPLATHNYYILNLIEHGIVGFTFFILTLFFLLKKLPYVSCSLCAVLLITMLILFNTEAIFLDSEFIFLIAFIASLCIHYTNTDHAPSHKL